MATAVGCGGCERVAVRASDGPGLREWSNKPLKGWNSCGAFFWSVSEEEMMANIDLTAKLLQPAGYNIIELGQHC